MAGMRDRDTVLAEYAGVHFGDARIDDRLKRIVGQILGSPAASFPEMMGGDADQEALYRFLANPKVTMGALLSGHVAATRARLKDRARVRIIHDTSEFTFAGERAGLGTLQGEQKKGFLGHFALAVGADEHREPFGVLAVHPFVNAHGLRGMTKSQKSRIYRAQSRAEKKSSRWEKQAIEVSAGLPEGVEAIHLMDQEADDYRVFCELTMKKLRFVIRADPRRLTAEKVRVDAFLATQAAQVFRTVPITARNKKKVTKPHPNRAERQAALSVRAGTIVLRPPSPSDDAPLEQLSVQAVHVFEASPPEGEAPIEWMLFTSEPVATLQDIEEVVDHYRARWVIEEYFKALKTGCAFEKRQLCSLDGLLRALALFVPMAWTLLALRTLGRETAERPASAVFSVEQLRLLRALLESRRRRLVQSPTVRDAMLGVAALGGHIKNNGDPGWQVLGRGLRRLTEAAEAWELMRNYDQS